MGALTLKSFPFVLRSWNVKSYESIDPTDTFGQNTRVYVNKNQIVKIEPQFNDKALKARSCLKIIYFKGLILLALKHGHAVFLIGLTVRALCIVYNIGFYDEFLNFPQNWRLDDSTENFVLGTSPADDNKPLNTNELTSRDDMAKEAIRKANEHYKANSRLGSGSGVGKFRALNKDGTPCTAVAWNLNVAGFPVKQVDDIYCGPYRELKVSKSLAETQEVLKSKHVIKHLHNTDFNVSPNVSPKKGGGDAASK